MGSLVIDGVIFGLQKSGGISRFWADAILGLDKTFAKKNTVTLLLPKNSNTEWDSISNQIKNIKVIKRRSFKWNKTFLWAELIYLTRIAWKLRPALWHSSYYVGLPLKFCPHTILSFYDMIPEALGLGSKYDSMMKYQAIKAADTVVAISHYSLQDLRAIWPQLIKKGEVIHLSASNGRKENPMGIIPPSSPYFLFSGRRSGYKNFLILMQKLLSDERFHHYNVVAVGGEGEFSKSEQELIDKHFAKKRVYYLGILTPSDVNVLTRNAAAVLYPSIYEGFGLPLLEGFTYGVPVLACRCTSITEIAGECYPLADPNDPATFPEILIQLLENKEKWVEYGKRRSTLFSQAKMIDALCELYEKQ